VSSSWNLTQLVDQDVALGDQLLLEAALDHRPQRLDAVELWRVGGQKLDLIVVKLAVATYQQCAVRLVVVEDEFDGPVLVLLWQRASDLSEEAKKVLLVRGLELLEERPLHSRTEGAVDGDARVALLVEYDLDGLLLGAARPLRSHPAVEAGFVAVDYQLLTIQYS
jgi:hypothetical protein